MSRVKILAPRAKGVQNGGKKVHVLCNGYNELAFLCNGADRHEILSKTINLCALLNLKRRILKIFT